MNPFAVTNLLHPRLQNDHRIAGKSTGGSDMEFFITRGAFRLINAVSRLSSSRH